MSLLKRRPDIQLFTPRGIVVGEPFSLRVVLECPEPIAVGMLEVELVGTGVWHTSSQHGRQRHALPFSRWVARPVTEARELPAGSHEFKVAFELPPATPGTYAGRLLAMEWTVRVHVDIPWWPDARATFVVHVEGKGSTAQPHKRRVFASATKGPQGRKPYAEVALGSARIESGGRLRGTVALSNTESNNYRSLQLALVAVESVSGFLSPTIKHNPVARWTLDVDTPQENAPIDFAITLPTGLVPAFRTRKLALEWFVEVRLDVAWAIDTKLWIPIDVHTPQAEERGATPAPLAVGSERLALIWAQAAKQTGFNYADGELTREVGGCRVVVRREHQGRRGLRLVGEVIFADADLGLRATNGQLSCRDANHSKILGECTHMLTHNCPIADADDERIICTVEHPGTHIEPVARLATELEAFVRAFEQARAQLPAPQDMAHMADPFRVAARRLGGDLDLASMDIRGVRDEIPFALETRWDKGGTLASTALRVCPSLPLDGRWHQRWHGSDHPRPMPAGVEELVRGATGLAVDAEAIELIFPPCVDNIEPHVARLEGLIAAAQRLSGQGLGYR